jgi:hypothetical protein
VQFKNKENVVTGGNFRERIPFKVKYNAYCETVIFAKTLKIDYTSRQHDAVW